MARLLAGLFGALLLVACGLHIAQSGGGEVPARPEGTLRLATLNVHYILAGRETGPWSVGDWEERREALDAAFKAIDADIFLFQEMETFEGGDDDTVNLARDFLLARNPGHRAAAVGDWRRFPSTQPVFYRPDRLRVVDQGWYFFSETPEAIYSRTFDGSYPAFASWVLFERRSDGQRLHVTNLHFDYGSRSNRHRSAELVAERVAPVLRAGGAAVVAGDLNDVAGSRTLDLVAGAGLRFLPVPGATFHLNRGLNLVPAIDHVALGGPVAEAGPPRVLRRRFEGRWPSDHHPVVVDFVLR
jgi:endonuclease/exonuclease/phosphatase family metal-dependent hydrolase